MSNNWYGGYWNGQDGLYIELKNLVSGPPVEVEKLANIMALL